MKKIVIISLIIFSLIINISVGFAFSDVDESFWGYNSITDMSNRGIINGFEDDTFKPNDTLTRAQFSKILVSSLDLEAGDNSYNYEDVPTEHWATSYINVASNYMNSYTDEQRKTRV